MNTASVNIPRAKQPSRLMWWHCALIYVVANGISFIPAGFNGDEAFYNNFLQPRVAPPDWMFAPVWFINNVTSLIALYIIANLPTNTPRRKVILRLEAATWVLYALFTLLYFGLKSPILGAIDTVFALVLTAVSFFQAYSTSRKAAWLIAPRLAWLLLASYVSLWVALHNKDVFFAAGPFLP